jgi:DNA polymerase-3 subunit alpha
MRLMGEEDEERPIEKYVRQKNDISIWYREMTREGLTPEEQEAIKPYFASDYGVPPDQESLMLMLMDKNICGFTLAEANSARKVVGKKQMNKIPELHQKVLDDAMSPALGKYIWKHGVGPQMGYSFSRIHALAYSFVGVQTLYIATNWSPIYWNTACLIVNSGSLEDNSEEELVDIYEPEAADLAEGITYTDLPDRSGKIRKTASTDYGKLAKAIGDIQAAGIKISLADINKSDFSFKPDVENNQILFGHLHKRISSYGLLFQKSLFHLKLFPYILLLFVHFDKVL